MELEQAILERRSVRKFTAEPIPHETMEQIVRLASYAPSWKNTQTVRYTVVEDRALLDRCAALAVQSVVTGLSGYEPDGSYSTSKKDGWEMYDAGISAQTFCLAAHGLGVGTVIMGICDDARTAALLQLPAGERVTALIAMGYPESAALQAPPRKDVDELLRYRP